MSTRTQNVVMHVTFLSEKKNTFPIPRQLFMPSKILIKYITTAGWTGFRWISRRLRLQYYKYLNNDGIHVHVKLLINIGWHIVNSYLPAIAIDWVHGPVFTARFGRLGPRFSLINITGNTVKPLVARSTNNHFLWQIKTCEINLIPFVLPSLW